MLRDIAVPLDGSAFAEQALPTALRIANRDRAALELVHVYESFPPERTQGAPVLDPRLDEELRRERAAYLEAVAEWLRPSTSGPVIATILDGPVGPTLVEHIATSGADLVVMALHGRDGRGVRLGSVARDVLRHSSAPVLLVRPDGSGTRGSPAPPFARTLVPLDGSPTAEEAIDHVVVVAGDPGVEFLLLHVVVPVVYLTEPPAQAFLDETRLEEAAATYLVDVASRMVARGLAARTRVLSDPQPARAIIEVAEDEGADLIAMETHGRSGVARLLMGSVAEEVVRASPVPVLLHRPRVAGTARASEAPEERGASGSRRA